MIIRLFSLTALALLAQPAAAQPAGDGAFAAYAIEFCAAVVDGDPPAEAAARAWPGAALSGPAPLGDDVDLVGRELDADRDTPVFILGPPGNPPRPIMAFARADATRCMTFDGEREDGVAALTARLTAAEGPWTRSVATDAMSAFDRNASGEDGVIRLHVIPGGRGQAARAIATRQAGRAVRITPDSARAWADAVIGACAAAVHQGRALDPDALAPHFVRGDRFSESRQAMHAAPGQPQGVMLVNTRSSACFITVASGDLQALHAGVIDWLTASGARREPSNRDYVLAKREGATGADALIGASPPTALLVISVRPR
ncbi:MAG: hypothetical protein NW203_03170 [Hyphomonadaceae bacterium]|nr:hypothetical protein [Hyphomonadaceae bacterium]